MIKLYPEKTYVVNGIPMVDGMTLSAINAKTKSAVTPDALNESTRNGTIAWSILSRHSMNSSADRVSVRFDSLASHDITYVGIIQTARSSGMTHFPLPYVLTNCHNSLCAVGRHHQ